MEQPGAFAVGHHKGWEVGLVVFLAGPWPGYAMRLAAQHMAPQLWGYSDEQGIASVVVMELLEGGWTTHYCKNRHRNGIQEGPKTRLLKRREDILDELCRNRMVHGQAKKRKQY